MKNMWSTWKPIILMVFGQITFSACNVLYKLAINDGMSTIVISAYRLAFAALITIPLALVFESKTRPKMTWRVFLLANLSGLIGGALFQNLFYGALTMTSATLVSAIYNLSPTITFILAVTCGYEKLKWGAASGKAKVIGTILGLAGAMVLTLYKGVEFDIWPFHINLLNPQQNQSGEVADTNSELLGVLCVVLGCFCLSLWLIIQAKISEVYPCPHSSIALMNIIGTIQCVIFGLFVVGDVNEWKLGWDIRLLTVAFSGIVVSGVIFVVIGWIVQIKGPLFASAFNPLMLVMVAIVASMLLDEKLNLGSILGGVLIVCGLYTVLWGKNKEMQNQTQSEPSQIIEDSDVRTPLLDP